VEEQTRPATFGANEDLRALALDRIRRRRAFLTHLIATLAGSVFLAIVWGVTEYHNAGGWPTGLASGRANHDWDPWIIYPLIGGMIALALHAWVAFGRRPASELDIAREMARLRRPRCSRRPSP
jgi:hypothetical protein